MGEDDQVWLLPGAAVTCLAGTPALAPRGPVTLDSLRHPEELQFSYLHSRGSHTCPAGWATGVGASRDLCRAVSAHGHAPGGTPGGTSSSSSPSSKR